jgi:hypothetical protein
MPQTRGSFWNQLAVFWVLLLMFCFAFYGSAQPLFNNIVTVQANLDGFSGSGAAYNGAQGGSVDVRTGTNIDAGDGRDGFLTASTTLSGPNDSSWLKKYYQQVAPLSPTGLILLTASGNVEIHCQRVFHAYVELQFQSGKPPPNVRIYAGNAVWLLDPTCVGQQTSSPCEAWPSSHDLSVEELGAGDGKPAAGGSALFYTPQPGSMTLNVSAQGSAGQQGKPGGLGGNVTAIAGNGDIVGNIVLIGGSGGNGVGSVGGNGGNGGTALLEAKNLTLINPLSVNGGPGGSGAANGNSPGFAGGNGGNGGHIEVDAATSSDFTALGGSGGAGGSGNPTGATGGAGSSGSIVLQPAPQFQPPNNWTIVVYLAADIEGKMSSALISQLETMESVDLGAAGIKVIVLLDRSPDNDGPTIPLVNTPYGRATIPSSFDRWDKWTDTRVMGDPSLAG